MFSGHNNTQEFLPGDKLFKENKEQIPNINSEEYQKAMEYLKNGKKAIVEDKNTHDIPYVYKRLWNNVAQKNKKVKQLTKAVED